MGENGRHHNISWSGVGVDGGFWIWLMGDKDM
jgi:hypothetical protein